MAGQKKNYLTNVIFRLDFRRISESELRSLLPSFLEKVKSRFPEHKEIKSKSVTVETKQLMEGSITLEGEDHSSWKLLSKDKQRIITLENTFIALEYLKYTKFQKFLSDISLISSALSEIYNVKTVVRIGLRYLNLITDEPGNPLNWKDLINPNLWRFESKFIRKNDEPKRSVHYIEFKRDSYNLRFQFGLFNSEYPSQIVRKEFTLDYDCVTHEETTIVDIVDKVKQFHKAIHLLFNRSIGKSLKERLELN